MDILRWHRPAENMQKVVLDSVAGTFLVEPDKKSISFSSIRRTIAWHYGPVEIIFSGGAELHTTRGTDNTSAKIRTTSPLFHTPTRWLSDCNSFCATVRPAREHRPDEDTHPPVWSPNTPNLQPQPSTICCWSCNWVRFAFLSLFQKKSAVESMAEYPVSSLYHIPGSTVRSDYHPVESV